ncbi:polymorphic toxin type 22 domain-containing protein, partial [Paraburkholderia dinghuensis]|uniref:polymorphic toxin type 22 domain-containing protein n=1 Tax=Paraburkholderia dinghuensis TaxID=2305225 RepID=UPI001628CA45
TNVIGSQVNGGQVTASVGGNLNIQSVQDTTQSNARQSSAGGGFSISQAGGSASFSAQNGHADGTYAQVNGQAGINAGSGGFDINVKGNTDLKGAVISSTADAEKNALTTGTLTYSDIENHSHYSANSNGIGAGVGVGSTGKATGPGSVSGTPGVSPMISQSDSGDQSATTRSAVSAGTINITNQAAQTQDVANLSRDTTNTNGTVSATPDVQNLLNEQADTMQAAQAAGQVVAQGIGAYADHKRNTATDAATYDAWDEGGDNRALLQAAGGALIGGLGGGSVFTAAGGAAGAGLASKEAQALDSIAQGVESETGLALLGNLAGNIAAGLSGALVGGTAGASMASNVQLYNQMLDPMKKKNSLIPSSCTAVAPCNEAVMAAQINATAANSQAALDTFTPNYATLNFGLLSGSAGGAINLYDGTKYLSFGVAQGNPASTSWSLGASSTIGWIFGANDATSTNNFMNGDSNQTFISIPTPFRFNVVGAVTHSYGGATAIEVGVGTPSEKISYGVVPWNHSTPVGKSAK